MYKRLLPAFFLSCLKVNGSQINAQYLALSKIDITAVATPHLPAIALQHIAPSKPCNFQQNLPFLGWVHIHGGCRILHPGVVAMQNDVHLNLVTLGVKQSYY
jgi:hypothetical protein